MKKYILTPVTQKNHTFYSMVADPREIVTAVKRAEAEEAQENQRPWSKKKVLEIVEYVMLSMPAGITRDSSTWSPATWRTKS